jgi:drug/metabolite transporter (DMT)-like permease
MPMASLFTEEHHAVAFHHAVRRSPSRFPPPPAGAHAGGPMSTSMTTVTLVIIGIALATVLGDWLLKLASQQEAVFASGWFWGGLLVYAGCSFGWVLAMQHMKLAILGVVSSLVTVAMLSLLGGVVFGETLSRHEVVGLVFAGAALVLLIGFPS